MRESLLETFSECYLLDLHGNLKKKERAPDGGKDENVFDIQQGVSVGLFVKHAGAGQRSSCAHRADLWGPRDTDRSHGKYDWLVANHAGTTNWTELAKNPPLRLFVPRDEQLNDEYHAGWKITDIFPSRAIRKYCYLALSHRVSCLVVLALFTVGDVYAALCKKGAYAPFSAQRRLRALFLAAT